MVGARGLTAGSRKSSALKHQMGPRTPHISKTHRILEITFAELYSAKQQGGKNNENVQTAALFSIFSSHVYVAHDSFRMLGNFDVILPGLNYGPGQWGQCCGPFDCQGPPRRRTWNSKKKKKKKKTAMAHNARLLILDSNQILNFIAQMPFKIYSKKINE